MKYLGPYVHDDIASIQALARNARLTSHPYLAAVLSSIEGRYRRYEAARGNACRMGAPLRLSEKLKSALRIHYSTKPGDLRIIDKIRDHLSPDVCPMCGSAKSSEVDHVAPKDLYPELSFFTKNLVPACECNRLKGLSYKGPRPHQRILHPYYDRIMAHRLLSIDFSGDFDAPDLELIILDPYADHPAVIYHVDSIVRKTNILSWASKKWGAVLRTPEAMFGDIRNVAGNLSSQQINEAIANQRNSKDGEFGTPNNWYSVMYTGLLRSPEALVYLAARINGLRAGVVAPDA